MSISSPARRQPAAKATVSALRRACGAALLIFALALLPVAGAAHPRAETADGAAALLARAAAQINAGRALEGAEAARRAYGLAGSRAARFLAARLAGAGYFRAGRFLRAELWLRRALTHAPQPSARQAVAREMAALSAARPLNLRLSLSLAPNSNVNNGAAAETVTLWSLPFVLSPDARALAGLEASAGLEATYRLGRSATGETRLGLALYGRGFVLSPQARRLAPGVRGAEYAFARAEAALTRLWRPASGAGQISLELRAGRDWYGGAPYSRYGRLSVARGFGPGPEGALRLAGSYERRVLAASGAASDTLALEAGGVRPLAGGDSLAWTLAASRTGSDAPEAANTALRAGLRYGFARPVLGAGLSLALALERRDFAFSPYAPGGRQDLSLSAGASLLFPGLSYMGFSPSLSLEWRRTISSVSLFSRNAAALRLGVQSDF